jgi:hypothetical protein
VRQSAGISGRPTARQEPLTSGVGAALGYGVAPAALELFDVPVLKASLVPSFGATLGLFVGVAQGLGAWPLGGRNPGRTRLITPETTGALAVAGAAPPVRGSVPEGVDIRVA